MQDLKRDKQRLEKTIKNLRVGVRYCMEGSLYNGDKDKNMKEYHRLQSEIEKTRKELNEIKTLEKIIHKVQIS